MLPKELYDSSLFFRYPPLLKDDLKLPLLNIRPQIELERKGRTRLRVQMPIRIRNLENELDWPGKTPEPLRLTASGLSFASSCPRSHDLVRGISMTPSMTACDTWTPCGPNSRARDCARARSANLAEAKEAKFADPLRLAVAPVKIRVGG